MKKHSWIGFVLAVVAVGIWIFYFASAPQNFSSAALLPASSSVLIEFPDLDRSKKRWETTSLAAILREPQMQQFLAPLIRQLRNDARLQDAIEYFEKIGIRRLFIASIEVEDASVPVILGFRFDGSRSALDEAFKRLRELMIGDDVVTETKNYHGVKMTMAWTGSRVLVTAVFGDWGVVGTSVDAIKNVIDREAGRVRGGSLAEDKPFLELQQQLQVEADLMAYIRPGPIVSAIASFGESMGATVDPGQLNALQQIQRFGYSMLLGKKDVEDRFVIQSRGDSTYLPLSRELLVFVPKKPLLYFQMAFAENSPFFKSIYARLPEMVQQMLRDQGIDTETINAAFGDQLGICMNWKSNEGTPELAVIVETDSIVRMEDLVTRVGAMLGANIQVMSSDNGKVFSWNSPVLFLLRPAVFVNRELAVIGILPGSIEGALATSRSGSSLLVEGGNPDILDFYDKDTIQFAYCDTAKLIENLHRVGAPLLSLSAVMSPELGGWIDAKSLPEASTITKHLQPTKYSLHRTKDYLIGNSNGPLTVSQLGLLLVLFSGDSDEQALEPAS